MKKLTDPEKPLRRPFSRLRGLRRHVGPILYQLPPGWRADADRFRYFLRALPRGARHVVEFREPTWYCPAIPEAMEPRGLVMCPHDMPGSATAQVRIGPFVHVRVHEATGRVRLSSSDDRLRRWPDWLRAQRESGCDVYAYFNNDAGGHPPRHCADAPADDRVGDRA